MATIPEPKTHEEAAKNQHLIPRCYMKPWYISGSESVWAYNKKDKYKPDSNSDWTIERKKSEKIMALNGFHDIKAGSLYMPVEAEHEIFDDVLQFNVAYNGKKLNTPKDWNLSYAFFDQWTIKDSNGAVFTADEKAKLKEYLEKTRWVYIETEWSRAYESQWNSFINQIESKAKAQTPGNKKIDEDTQNISCEEFKKLIKYSVVFDWRSVEGNVIFNEIQQILDELIPLKTMSIPEGQRVHGEDKTAGDEIQHNLILKAYIKYLQNDDGWMKVIEDHCMSNCTLSIWLTDSAHQFITSDNPSFSVKNENGKLVNYFVALPTMLISYSVGNPAEYVINLATESQVMGFNKMIAQNGNMLIVDSQAYNIESRFQ